MRAALSRRIAAEAAIVLAGSLLLVLAITWPLVLNLQWDAPRRSPSACGAG